MAKATLQQTSFVAGETSPLLSARIDLQQYADSASLLSNWIVFPQGPVHPRPGTRFVAATKTAGKLARLIRFVFSSVQAYMLEFGEGYIRFYKDGGVIESSPGVPYEVSTTYTEAELATLYVTQSADVMFIACPTKQPRTLTRSGHTSWTLALYDFKEGPFLDENKTTTTLTPSGTTGAITITASASLFVPADVGRVVRIQQTNKWGTAKITGYTSATQVSATTQDDFTNTTANASWRLGAWGDGTIGWPSVVTFHQQRLVWANTATEPNKFWMTRTGDYYNFAPTILASGASADSTDATCGITFALNANEVNVIKWMSSSRRLLIGTQEAEWVVDSSSTTVGISPDTIKADPQTPYGSYGLPPVRIGNQVVFLQRNQKSLRAAEYALTSDSYEADDITDFAPQLFGAKVTDMAYAQDPYSILWLALDSGLLIGATYNKNQKILAFHRHTLGGSLAGADMPLVESVEVIPSTDGSVSTLWMIVKRTIQGNTVRYVEYLEIVHDPKSKTDLKGAFYVDCGLSYNGSPTTSITGLTHLAGQEVVVLADGATHPNCTVTGAGGITLNNAASVVHVGLGRECWCITNDLEGGSQQGVSQGNKKKGNFATYRVVNSSTFYIGYNDSELDEVVFRDNSDPMDAGPPLFTGDIEVTLPASQGTGNKFVVYTNLPLPVTLCGIFPNINVQEQ